MGYELSTKSTAWQHVDTTSYYYFEIKYENQNLFSSIGILPSVIITRWSSWVRTAMYCCDNFPEIKRIVFGIAGIGILVNKAKEVVSNNNIIKDLVTI